MQQSDSTRNTYEHDVRSVRSDVRCVRSNVRSDVRSVFVVSNYNKPDQSN